MKFLKLFPGDITADESYDISYVAQVIGGDVLVHNYERIKGFNVEAFQNPLTKKVIFRLEARFRSGQKAQYITEVFTNLKVGTDYLLHNGQDYASTIDWFSLMDQEEIIVEGEDD